jgi:dTMP kinase
MAARFITFEGGEGSGKSTQARMLAARLQAAGTPTVLTREPGGSPFAERVRGLLLDAATPAHPPLAEALLFYAARADHLSVTIRPALAAGIWVICDRFSDSTRVYQGAAGDVPAEALEGLERIVVVPTTPDLTLIIDIDVAEGLARAHARRSEAANAREADRYEARDAAFHETLRRGFLELARQEPQRCAIIDGRGTAEDVAERVWRAVGERLELDGGA